MYSQSIENSYQLISGNATLEQLLVYLSFIVIEDGQEFPEDMMPVFFIEPDKSPTIEDINEMIGYFETQEEYEKCQYLKDFKLKLN
jgi:hypothetical protein